MFFYAVLCLFPNGVIGIHLHERLVPQVLGFVDFPFVHSHLEVIVVVVLLYVVFVARQDVLACDVGAYVVVFNPEHGVFDCFASEVARTVKYRADGLDGRFYLRGAAVEYPFFQDIVGEYLVGGYIAFLYREAGILLGVSFCRGIQNMEAVEHFFYFDAIFVGEYFSSIEVFVCRYLVVRQKFHDNSEKILLIFGGLFGIIERHVFFFVQVDLPIDYPHPRNVGIRCILSVIKRLSPDAELVACLFRVIGIAFFDYLCMTPYCRP